jgi:acetylglutamate kinase
MILETLITEGYLPVVSPVAADENGIGYNVNADLVAAAIGGALRADSVIFLTDVAGIYRNWPDQSSLISEITIDELKEIAPSFSEGMIPKVAAAIKAIDSGAFAVRITDGTDLSCVLDALDDRGGTLVSA